MKPVIEDYTIVNQKTQKHYDTNEEKFLNESWNRTLDKREYLELLISNNPEKFQDCEIENYFDF